MELHIVVCAGLAPDPLQTLEPAGTPEAPALKNEAMLPAVLDPWAAHALWDAAAWVKENPGSKLWLLAMAPKQKLQQVMMTVAQKVPFDLVPVDGPSNGFIDAAETAVALSAAIGKVPGLDKSKLLLAGGWESATRGAGVTLGRVAARLGIEDVFLGVDEVALNADGSLTIKERVEGGAHWVSKCPSLPVAIGWATGMRPEPPNHPQTGMANMRTLMPALQKASPAPLKPLPVAASLPKVVRETKIVKDKPAAEIARELAEWIRS